MAGAGEIFAKGVGNLTRRPTNIRFILLIRCHIILFRRTCNEKNC